MASKAMILSEIDGILDGLTLLGVVYYRSQIRCRCFSLRTDSIVFPCHVLVLSRSISSARANGTLRGTAVLGRLCGGLGCLLAEAQDVESDNKLRRSVDAGESTSG